jgi:hypothetical protein
MVLGGESSTDRRREQQGHSLALALFPGGDETFGVR